MLVSGMPSLKQISAGVAPKVRNPPYLGHFQYSAFNHTQNTPILAFPVELDHGFFGLSLDHLGFAIHGEWCLTILASNLAEHYVLNMGRN